jgi:hypothetical protein
MLSGNARDGAMGADRVAALLARWLRRRWRASARGRWSDSSCALLACLLTPSCLDLIGDVEIAPGDESVKALPVPVDPEDASAACEDGMASGGACIIRCEPDAARCSGLLLQRCNASGDGWVVVDQCASGALCDATLLECLPAECAAHEHRCTASGELQICTPDRTGYEPVEQCRSAAFCSAVRGREACTETACRAGRERCNGAQIERCREDRTGFDAVGPPCASAALCKAGDAEVARCEPPSCGAGEFACQGSWLARCADERNGLLPLVECRSALSCNSAERRCNAPPCMLDEQRCNGSRLERCSPSLTGFVSVAECGQASLCDPAAPRCLTTPAPPPPLPPAVVSGEPYDIVSRTSTSVVLGLGPLQLSLPAEWTDIDERPWLDAAGQSIGPQFVASTDVARFGRYLDLPGVYFAASAQLPIDVANTLSLPQFDLSGQCTLEVTEPYSDGLYTGTSQTWINCGSTSATNVVVAALPEDRSFVTVVIVTRLSARDRDAQESIWSSFEVKRPLP